MSKKCSINILLKQICGVEKISTKQAFKTVLSHTPASYYQRKHYRHGILQLS